MKTMNLTHLTLESYELLNSITCSTGDFDEKIKNMLEKFCRMIKLI